MAIILNEQQKNNIKNSTFTEISFKRCIIDSLSATHDRLKIHLYINDFTNNSKIVDNLNSKNLKLAIFYYNDESFLNNLSSFSSIQENKNILKNNFLKEIYVKDYVGKNLNESSLISGDTYELNYIFELDIPKNFLQNIFIGAFLYIDANQYCIENNISISNINFYLMESKIYSFNIIKNFEPETDKLFDLRLISKLQKNNFNTNNATGLPELRSLNDVKLQKKFLEKKPNNYFTEAYFSFDKNEKINLLFGLDKSKILSDSISSVKEESEIELDFSKSENLFKIISLTIFRKEFTKNYDKNVKNIEKVNSYKEIISTLESDGVLLEKQIIDKISKKVTSKIKEGNLFSNIKTIEFCDYNLSTKNQNSYEYGVKININNGYYTYLENIKKRLELSISTLNSYILNTEKDIFYNHVREIFYQSFYDVYVSQYQRKMINLINDFIMVLQELSMTSRIHEDEIDNLSVLLSNLVDPLVTNSFLINKFIDLINNILYEVSKEIKKVKNINLNKEYVFKQKIEIPFNLKNGYSYFYKKNLENIFLNISSKNLVSKIQNDIVSYCNLPLNSNYNYFISPSILFFNNEEINMVNFVNDQFVDNRQTLTNNNFKDLDVKIKLYEKNKNNETSPDMQDIQTNLLSCIDNSINILNLFDTNDEKEEKILNGKYSKKIRKNLNIDNLILSLLKKNNGDEISVSDDMPFQITSLLKQQSKYFISVENAFNNLNLNSKFLFLYNTLCKISFLKTNGDIQTIKNAKWTSLNVKELNKLAIGEKILCKLELFQIKNNKYFNKFEEISLPIYDEYFIVENNVSNLQEFNLEEPTPVSSPTIFKMTTTKIVNNQISKVVSKLAIKQNIVKQYTKIIRPYIPPRKIKLPLNKSKIKNIDDF